MKLLLCTALLLSHFASAAPFALAPCPSGSPTPTECRCSVNGGAAVVKPPHTAGSTTYCYCDLAALTGTVSLTLTAVNSWGSSAPRAGSLNMLDYAAPAQLGTISVVPALP